MDHTLNITLNVDEIQEAVMDSDMNEVMKYAAAALFNAVMEAERDEYMITKRYERSESRTDYRNGYYERDYVLKIGRITLKVPRTRSGEFSPTVFERHKRMDQAFVLPMIEMYINGVSTAKVGKIVKKLVGEDVSASFVSNANKKLDPLVKEFRGKSLTDQTYLYVYTDAMYIKVRENHQVVSKAVYIAIGVTKDKKREVIGFTISDQESETMWSEFFTDLQARGLNQPIMIISDAHPGLVTAIEKHFPGTKWQRCTMHFIKNITDKMPKKNSETERAMVKAILRASSQQKARELKKEFEEFVADNPRYDQAVECLDNGFEDAIQYMTEPHAYRVSLRTTNNLERLNGEIRRRDKVIRIYPNIESAERLIGAVLMDIDEKWEKSNRKFLKDHVNALDERWGKS